MGRTHVMGDDGSVRVSTPESGSDGLQVAAVGAAVLVAVGGVVVAGLYDRASPGGAAATGFVVGAYALVGAVVTLTVPDNLVGWLMLAAAAASGLGIAVTEAGVYGVVTSPGSVRGSDYLAAVGPGLRAVGWVLAVLAVPAVFPDGRLPGPRWRWLAWTIALATSGLLVSSLLDPQANETRLAHWRNPLAPPDGLRWVSGGLSMVGVLAGAVATVGVVAGLVSRWRRGGAQVRQQLLLLALAACPPALVILLVVPTGGLPPWAFALALLPIPLAIAVAVLGYGVYDLRRATYRTLLWVTLSGVLLAVYAAVVLVVAILVPDRDAWWPPAVGAVVAVLLLAPLQGAVQRRVTRVVYGRWREPYEVLAELGEQLAAAGDVDRLIDVTVAELAVGLSLRDVSVRDVYEAPADHLVGLVDGHTSLELSAFGSTVGWLGYAPTRPLSPVEQRLLRDLARPLGAALHARRLRDELQQARERLVLAREEERRRLRRDLHDGVGPALAGLTLKAETARALLPRDATAASAQLAGLGEDIRLTVLDVRRLVEGLRPPALDELGLVAACDQAVSRLTAAAGVDACVHADGPVPPLPAAVEVAAYRIVVEAVTNILRHASASRCDVALSATATTPLMLRVVVTDDGGGLRGSQADGNGLSIMRERAEEIGGRLTVHDSAPGVRVEASLPVHQPAEPAATRPEDST